MSQQKLQNHFADFIHLLGPGFDDQIPFYRVKAGRNEFRPAPNLCLNCANAA